MFDKILNTSQNSIGKRLIKVGKRIREQTMNTLHITLVLYCKLGASAFQLQMKFEYLIWLINEETKDMRTFKEILFDRGYDKPQKQAFANVFQSSYS